jgi:hypothetical protein
MGVYNPIPRTLWQLSQSGIGTTVTASGNSGAPSVDLQEVTDVWLSLYLGAAPTGTSPTLAAQLDVLDPDGNWITAVCKTATVNASGGSASAFAGLHMPNVSTSSAAFPLPRWGRVAWTIGGTGGPSFTVVSMCLSGR